MPYRDIDEQSDNGLEDAIPLREKRNTSQDDEDADLTVYGEEHLDEKLERRKPGWDIDLSQLRNAPFKQTSHAFIFALVCGLVLVGYLVSYFFVGLTRYGHTLQVNVILMVSDGFGPASETFAREYVQWMHAIDHPDARTGGRWEFSGGFQGKDGLNNGGFGTLPLDSLLVGSMRTRSSNSLVTDSAAAATAFSCAIKTYNGALAVEPVSQNPCGSVLEAAKHKGYLTGLVATSRLTHATPAAFYSHVVDRDLEPLIATQFLTAHPLGPQVDIAFGGGRCFFLPNSTEGSCRPDDKDLFEDAKKDMNLKVITSAAELASVEEGKKGLGTVGLFNLDHMDYEVDRIRKNSSTSREPSLKEMSMKAINTLQKAAKSSSSYGFFLMIEGSRIDMAGHSNDPVAHLYDILAYHETVREVKRFVDTQNKAGWPTVMISVADHETGGLSLGSQLDPQVYPEYLWYPDALANATHSTFSLASEIHSQAPASESTLRTLLSSGLGIMNATEDEIRSIQDHDDHPAILDTLLADMISRRAQVGWSTHGHSGVDVALYAYGYQSEQLRGSVDNTAIGKFIANTMSIDLPGTTTLLERTSKAWHNKTIVANNNRTNVQHYHGLDQTGQKQHLYLDRPGTQSPRKM